MINIKFIIINTPIVEDQLGKDTSQVSLRFKWPILPETRKEQFYSPLDRMLVHTCTRLHTALTLLVHFASTLLHTWVGRGIVKKTPARAETLDCLILSLAL